MNRTLGELHESDAELSVRAGGPMKKYEVSLEISGPTAMLTRPDTGDAPVSYPAPTYGVVKGIFESIFWVKPAEVVPTRVESCAPLVFHMYSTNYGWPSRKNNSKNSRGVL